MSTDVEAPDTPRPEGWVRAYLSSAGARWAAAALLAVGIVLRLFVFPNQPPTPYRIDIDVYRTGAQVLLAGGDLYGKLPELVEGFELPFTYPPIAAVVFTVFAVMPLWTASLLLTLASIVALWVVVRAVLPHVRSGTAHEAAWLAVGACAVGLWLSPVWETLDFGQVNLLLMLLCAVDGLRGRGCWWGGTLVGLATAIKLTPAVFLLLFVLRRDVRSAVMAVVSFVFFTLVGHLVSPSASMQYWTSTLIETDRIGDPGYAANQSVNGMLARFGAESRVVWFIVALAAGLFIAWMAHRSTQASRHVDATLIVAASALLCSPVSWTHHWVWVVPLAVVLALTRRRGALALAATALLVFVVPPHVLLPSRHGMERDWTWFQHLVGNAFILWLLAAVSYLGWKAATLPPQVREPGAGAPTTRR